MAMFLRLVQLRASFNGPFADKNQLHATLPVFLFISPNMPIDDENNMVNRGSHSIDAAAAIDDLTPPQYGEHQFDRLYSDIDPSGYITPAGGASGVGTPFQSRSRSVSTENLVSLDGVASSDFAANVLQTRLSNLDVAGSNRLVRDRQLERSQLSSSGDGVNDNSSIEGTRLDDNGSRQNSLPNGSYFGQQHSPSNSDPASRRVSEEDGITSGPVTPQHIEYSAESLAKVPSYTAALQSQTRTPINDGLPTYQTATHTPVARPSMPQPLSQIQVNRTNRGS